MSKIYGGVLTQDGFVVARWDVVETDATDVYRVDLGVKKPEGFWRSYSSSLFTLDTPPSKADIVQLVTDVMLDEEMDYLDRWGE